MLKKRKVAGGKVRVTFAMPATEGVSQLFLSGEFNDWSETATPMTRVADGSWSVTLTLEGGRSYEYRYLADTGDWHNDWAADSYLRNPYGADNSVVDLSADSKPARTPRKKAAAK